jgi:ankyrin repeat protein
LAAIRDGQTKVFKALIEAGSSVDIKNEDGDSALKIAALKKNVKIIELLLSARADIKEVYTDKSSYIAKILEWFFPSFVNTKENDSNIETIIALYKKKPIEYILKHNSEAKYALNAMKNLESQEDLVELLPIIERTEDCLANQPEGIIELNVICGEDGSHYIGFDL